MKHVLYNLVKNFQLGKSVIKKFRQTGSVTDKSRERNKSVLPEQKLQDIKLLPVDIMVYLHET